MWKPLGAGPFSWRISGTSCCPRRTGSGLTISGQDQNTLTYLLYLLQNRGIELPKTYWRFLPGADRVTLFNAGVAKFVTVHPIKLRERLPKFFRVV